MLLELIKQFRIDKNKNTFKNLQMYVDHTATQCRLCNDVIYYDNTIVRYNKKTKEFKYGGTTYKTCKIINDKEYNLTVCQSCMEYTFENYKNINKTKVYNVMSVMTKFAFDITDVDFINSRDRYAMTLDNMIKKYGNDEGLKVWNNYCSKQSETNTFEYKKDKYGWSKEQFEEYNLSRSVTLDNCKKRHGDIKGVKIFNDYVEKQRTAGITYEYFITTYGKEDGENKYYNMLSKKIEGGLKSTTNSISNQSKKFFKKLELELKKYNIINVFYSLKNKEKRIQLKSLKKFISLDFYIPDLNICVEYNGDPFHGNPKLFKCDDMPLLKILNREIKASELWEKDNLRYNALKEEYDITTHVVWESDIPRINIKDFVNNTLGIK